MSSFLSRMAKRAGHLAKDVGHVAAAGARAVTDSPIGSVAQMGLSFVPGGNLVNAGLDVATGHYGSAALDLIPGGKAVGALKKAGSSVGLISTGARVLGKLVRAAPMVGKAATVAGVGYAGYKAVSSMGGGGGGPTAMPTMPALPAMANEDMGNQHAGPSGQGAWGLIPWWKGPGGRLQFPWNDPSAPQPLKQFALDDSYLKLTYRAPKGYVVIRDSDGQPLPVLKMAAQKMGYWRPHKKPPISVGEWQAVKRAHGAVKKMHRIFRVTTNVERNIKGGKVIVHRHKKAR
jgi:hypothetical protein